MSEAAPWDRMPDESDAAWRNWCRYRDLGAVRSLPRLASEIVGETPEDDRKPESVQRQLERWSSKYRWQDRARAWDQEMDRRSREEAASEMLAMRRRQARQMATLADVLMAPALELAERLQAGGSGFRMMDDSELVATTLACAKVIPTVLAAERSARGSVDDAVPQRGAESYSQPDRLPSEEELLELWAALEEVGISPIGQQSVLG